VEPQHFKQLSVGLYALIWIYCWRFWHLCIWICC